MSRGGDYDDDYDGNFPNEWAFWEHRMEQVVASKRGRQALAELREALLALPQPRLVSRVAALVRAEQGGLDAVELNDGTWGGQTPEERWQSCMSWLDKKLAVPASAAEPAAEAGARPDALFASDGVEDER